MSSEPSERPHVDQRLVAPETRYEIDDGRVVYVPPADEPHGTRHSKVAALLEAHVTDAVDVAVDMLTRTSVLGDMAPDVSVFPVARDLTTGGRQIEQLAFEVSSTERLSEVGAKAAKLVDRGVRRVFVVDVERRRALEWSTATGTWEILARDGMIQDATLAAPLPIRALVDAAKADDAVARALLVKRNPVIVEAIDAGTAHGRAQGKAEGKAESILVVLRARHIVVPPEVAERIRSTRDVVRLDAWLGLASTCTGIEGLLD